MKLFLLGTASAVALLGATPALAQDAPASGSAFGGPYVGLQLGMGKVESIHSDLDYWYNGEKDGTTVDRGAVGGLRAGYDVTSGSLLAGGLVEVNFGKLNSIEEAIETEFDGEYEIGTRVTRYGSLRGKIGLTDGNLAAFVTAGIARSNARQRFVETDTDFAATFSGKGDRSGTVIGLGLEYALGASSIGLDYSEYRFGSKSHEVVDGGGELTDDNYDMRYNIKSLSVTYAYRFGGVGTAAAAVAADAAFSGPYVGLHAGLGEMNAQHEDVDYWYDGIDRGLTTDRNGLGGLHVGYDHLLGNILVGALAEVTFGKLDSFQSAGAVSDDLTYALGVRTSRLGSIRGKLGFVSGKLAAYATGGLARSNAKVKFREEDGSGEAFDSKADRSGYVVGLGAAYLVGGNSSLGLDYSEYRFGKDRNEIFDGFDGSASGYFFEQRYKVRALNLTFNYGF